MMARLVMAAVAALGVLAGCNPDPSTGTPPPPGEAAPAFASVSSPVGPGTAWPLGDTWREGCPVHHSDLAGLEVSHWGYDGHAATGRVVVHVGDADAITEVFRQLYEARFQIERLEPIDAFGGDDDASMAANNSSAFNCRTVAGTSRWSEHAYGRAIDLNPVQNPYVRGDLVEPPAGEAWRDREHVTPGMITDGDAVVRAFASQGWGWGGHWASSKDYQHFSATGR
ncbi:MAG TPA: M15 family metallopeptidase [Acidimicrobiales bacterium]|nr:M15 family metallopeptidase [Acidimicrobiales bacterium]